MEALQNYLTQQLSNLVRNVDGIDREVKMTMNQAIKGGFDYVFTDIGGNIEGQDGGIPDFFTLMEDLRTLIEMSLNKNLRELEFMNAAMGEEIIEETLRQMENTRGFDFFKYTELDSLALLEDPINQFP